MFVSGSELRSLTYRDITLAFHSLYYSKDSPNLSFRGDRCYYWSDRKICEAAHEEAKNKLQSNLTMSSKPFLQRLARMFNEVVSEIENDADQDYTFMWYGETFSGLVDCKEVRAEHRKGCDICNRIPEMFESYLSYEWRSAWDHKKLCQKCGVTVLSDALQAAGKELLPVDTDESEDGVCVCIHVHVRKINGVQSAGVGDGVHKPKTACDV